MFGRLVGQRGDTTVLRDAYAVSPQAGSSGHCRFRIAGEAFGASGAVVIAVSSADWDWAPPP